MPRLKVAHIREQGQQMILVPLDRSFGYKSEETRREAYDSIQRIVGSKLQGRVVLFWPSGNGSRFMGPPPWRPFLEGLTLGDVWASVNKEISWFDPAPFVPTPPVSPTMAKPSIVDSMSQMLDTLPSPDSPSGDPLQPEGGEGKPED